MTVTRIDKRNGRGLATVLRRLPQLLLGASLLAALGAGPSNSAAPRGGGSILRRAPQLETRISLAERQVFLGELLDRISRETGVRVTASDRVAPISGYEVTAIVYDRPAVELLEGLATLYNSPPDRWYWSVAKSRGRRVYVLRNNRPAATAGRALTEFGHQFRAAQLRRRQEFFQASPSRRALMAANSDELRAANNTRSAGFFSFVASLTERDLRAFAAGRRVDIAVDQLSGPQRQFIANEFQLSRPRANGAEPTLAGLSKVSLYYSNGHLILRMGPLGGHAILGGLWLRRAKREYLERRWLAAGGNQDAEDKLVPAPEAKGDYEPQDLLLRQNTSDEVVFNLARAAHINVLFDRQPDVESIRMGTDDYGLEGRLPEVLANLQKQDLLWKRSGSFYLFRRLDWPQARRETVTPWPVIKQLRRSAAKHDGFLRPEDWFTMAELPTEALVRLAKEFPDAGYVRRHRVIFRLAGHANSKEREALARPVGAGWKDWSGSSRRRLLALLPPLDARLSRTVVQWDLNAEAPTVRVYFGPNRPPLGTIKIPFRQRREPKADNPRK